MSLSFSDQMESRTTPPAASAADEGNNCGPSRRERETGSSKSRLPPPEAVKIMSCSKSLLFFFSSPIYPVAAALWVEELMAFPAITGEWWYGSRLVCDVGAM
ncbi:unnamed protein product [Lactuca virosa]|uniref:Uncharacterized protein n=1 Tax=Lactuca virosa TaxID=75947 RepID=A0AAU9M9X3_9ASTR|nr:unnamed protein product [Lactuca virosa]